MRSGIAGVRRSGEKQGFWPPVFGLVCQAAGCRFRQAHTAVHVADVTYTDPEVAWVNLTDPATHQD